MPVSDASSASADIAPRPKPRLVFLATETYFFDALRKEIAAAAVREAFDIYVVSSSANSAEKPRDGFKLVEFAWTRSRTIFGAAIQFLPELYRVRRLLDTLRPDILHNLALKPSIIGSLAVRSRKVKIVNSLTGLGFVFYAASPLARAAQRLSAFVLRRAVARNDAHVVVLNTTDAEMMERRMGIPKRNIHLIRGSGIDLNHYRPLPMPADQPFRFLVIARLLYMKGIHIALAAHDLMRARGIGCELVICGAPDAGNPSSIPDDVIAQWARRPGVRFMGQVPDVRAIMAECHVVVHPALGGEGLPRVLQEGAACGRALIATDIAGNRDVVIAGETGMLVPPDDAVALADAMQWAMNHPADREKWIANGLTRIAQTFATELVSESYTALYENLCPFSRA